MGGRRGFQEDLADLPPAREGSLQPLNAGSGVFDLVEVIEQRELLRRFLEMDSLLHPRQQAARYA